MAASGEIGKRVNEVSEINIPVSRDDENHDVRPYLNQCTT